MEEVKQELDRLVALKSEDNWKSSVRNNRFYNIVERKYSFGKKMCYEPAGTSDYVNLQSSRSLSVEENDRLDAFVDRAKSNMGLRNQDLVRISEIDDVVRNKSKVVELGFRLPILLKYYSEQYGSEVVGYDIVPISVMMGKELGYDVRQYDLSKCEDDLDIGDANLILCYHVLEHITDPMVPIRKIYESMKEGAYFHVEVPIENVPNLECGHLFPFGKDELGIMLSDVGFRISRKTDYYIGGNAERYIALK